MSKKHRRFFLKEKESRELLERASRRFKVSLKEVLKEKVNVETVETAFGGLCLIDGKPLLVVNETRIFPTLAFRELFEILPRIVVDMGAVPFVCKGANIMAPGIRRFEGHFDKGDLVYVVDEKYGKPVALGEATYDFEEAKTIKQGKVAENIHYVGDCIWELIKDLDTKLK